MDLFKFNHFDLIINKWFWIEMTNKARHLIIITESLAYGINSIAI